MSLLNVVNVSHHFGGRQILKNASFRLLKGEHVGIVGANGEGKSTFINIILGNELPSEGKIEWAKHLDIGYLDQFSTLTKGKTIRDVLKEAFSHMFELEEQIYKNYELMGDADEVKMQELLDEIGEMQSTLEQSGFYMIDAKIEEVSNGLGLQSIGLDKDVSELSGGERAKVLLTKVLLQNPGILILDEPTNYLDENHINWLRNYLNNFENAFILVSHDTAFLNSVINVVYHIDNGVLTRYSGNYDQFISAYEMKKRQAESAYEQQQREIKQMEDFIARNKARVATRGMANSRQKKLDKMERLDKGRMQIKPNFVFKEGRPSGKVLFRAENLVLGYDRSLTKPFDIEIVKGEHLVIKGINGVGKSTLIKTLLGVIKPFDGKVEKSPTITLGYFEQEVPGNRNTPRDEIWDSFPTLTQGEVHAALAACGLTYEQIDSQIITLSGGEAAKVRLCKLTIGEYNCLVLDEPTNHLDVLSKEALQEAIKNYTGTILLVCHEAEFYQAVATRVINLEDYAL